MGMRYAAAVMRWLWDLGYSHCYFVAGGNIMHLLNAAHEIMTCVPFVHEVAAGMAAEYHNESRSGQTPGKAFALVTAGPGLTNAVTAFAGAYLESRELLVLGGQAKTTDLATRGLRQRGIQEVDGVAIASPVTVAAERLKAPWPLERFASFVRLGSTNRPGPVFLEFPLDVQAAPVPESFSGPVAARLAFPSVSETFVSGPQSIAGEVADRFRNAQRPVLLIGGGVGRDAARRALGPLREQCVPTMTTWNAADRLGAAEAFYLGRPNTWGQRSANVLLQQADLIVALGTRLGLQQTGFNWQEFAPLARVVQVDIDLPELTKGHPAVDLPLQVDANTFLMQLLEEGLGDHREWLSFGQTVRKKLPLSEACNVTAPGYVNPYELVSSLSRQCEANDVIIPCSSGGAFTVMMQAFEQKNGQVIISNKGLASMGYGLSGAIGAALANPDKRVVLVEGDGGFSQNLQELATVKINRLFLKMFIFSNEGYASIRMNQKAYFQGSYLGCDPQSGLGFPNWEKLLEAYEIPYLSLTNHDLDADVFQSLFSSKHSAAFVVRLDPEQTYFPKISSVVTPDGGMKSQPLHLMTPPLDDETRKAVFKYL